MRNEIEYLLKRELLRGGNFYCPCCGGKYRKFIAHGLAKRENALCPRCHSLERHRLLILFLKERTNLFKEPCRLLHFAPEACLRRNIRKHSNIDYITTDLMQTNVDIRMDITDNLFKDGVFDAIICSHVLEHIPDDRAAMREIYRVLKPGGWALLHVPMNPNMPETYEDFSITDPKEREKAFGQHDHVRIYGRDYLDRLKESGFQVKVDDFAWKLDEATVKRMSIIPEDIYICEKKS